MAGVFTRLLRGPACRRVIAAACALTLIFVSFAHALQHVDGTGGKAGYELSSTGAAGDFSDQPESGASVEPCHACCGMTALPARDEPGLEAPKTFGCTAAFVASIRPHWPTLENPPPITPV